MHSVQLRTQPEVTLPTLTRAIPLLLLAALSACLQRRPRDAEMEAAAGSATGQPATLVIENESIWDVRVFAVRSTQNIRLGLVTAGQSGTFSIPAHLIARDLTVLADPVGARTRLRTDSFVAWPGNEVRITLEKRLRSYGISIY